MDIIHVDGENIVGVWDGPVSVEVNGVFPSPRGGHSASFIDHKVWIFGGSAFTKTPNGKDPLPVVQDELFVFDTQSRTWTKVRGTGIPPVGRYGHSATQIGKKIIFFGGFNGTRYLNDLFLFDTHTLVWYSPPAKGSKIPSARYAHSSTLVSLQRDNALTHRILIFGGCGESSVYNEVVVFDIGTMSWMGAAAVTGSLPPARAYHTASLIGNKMWIFGGRAGNRYFNDIYSLDIESMNWEKPSVSGNVPSARAYHTAFTVGTSIIVFGGMDGTKCFNETFVFDTVSCKWSQIVFGGKVPSARHKHSACVAPSPKRNYQQVWMFGGMEAPPNGFNDLYVLSFSPKESLLNLQINEMKHSITSTADMQHSQKLLDFNKLRDELDKCYSKIDYLSAKNLERYSLSDIEELEKLYLEGLMRISAVKKEKIIMKCKQELQKHSIDSISMSLDNLTTSAAPVTHAANHSTTEQLQETVTKLQNENLKLRKRLKENGIDLMEGVQKGVSVGFGTVSTREFLPLQGQGVPSGGAAPLGMDMIPIRENSESLHSFEKRRELERKGVVRIPEEERIQILKSSGVSDDSLNEEARYLDQLNWNRLQSISSPTENPLPEVQRTMYRNLLNQSL